MELARSLGDGTVLLGTGNDGKVFRVSGGQVALAATTGQMAVELDGRRLERRRHRGHVPRGQALKIPAGQRGGAAAVFATLPPARGRLGARLRRQGEGALRRHRPGGQALPHRSRPGKAQVYFDSDEPHLISVAVADDGTVYAGSNGKALLYKITGPGRATVLYDFDADDVKAIAVAPPEKGGACTPIANKYNEAFASPKRNKAGPPGPQPTKAGAPRQGRAHALRQGRRRRAMIDDDEAHYISLTLGDDGQPYVGTGAEGRLYTVDDNHLERLVADTEERQIGAVVMAGKRKFLGDERSGGVPRGQGRGRRRRGVDEQGARRGPARHTSGGSTGAPPARSSSRPAAATP